jgi:hypothetical protein
MDGRGAFEPGPGPGPAADRFIILAPAVPERQIIYRSLGLGEYPERSLKCVRYGLRCFARSLIAGTPIPSSLFIALFFLPSVQVSLRFFQLCLISCAEIPGPWPVLYPGGSGCFLSRIAVPRTFPCSPAE